MKHEKKSGKISDLRQKTHDGVDKMMDKAERIKESGKEAIDSMKVKGMKMKKNVDGYIKENPEKAVLIAAATGAVVGAVITAVIKKNSRNEEKAAD